MSDKKELVAKIARSLQERLDDNDPFGVFEVAAWDLIHEGLVGRSLADDPAAVARGATDLLMWDQALKPDQLDEGEREWYWKAAYVVLRAAEGNSE